MSWPDTPARMSEVELEEFVLGWTAEKIHSNRHLPSFNGGVGYSQEFASCWPMFELALQAQGMPPDGFAKKVGLFWSWVDRKVTQSPSGLPVFSALPSVMHLEDLLKVRGLLEPGV